MNRFECQAVHADQDQLVDPGPARDVVRGREAEILSEITWPGIAACIWERRLPEAMEDWLDGALVCGIPEVRCELPVHLVEAELLEACERVGLVASAGRDLFCQDVSGLALQMAQLLGCERVLLRVEIARDAQCPKFHLDHVPARLLCTYRGPGTEYVVEDKVDEPSRYRHMKQGAVGLFHGALWGTHVKGEQPVRPALLHRSPALSEADSKRLLLVLDPLF